MNKDSIKKAVCDAIDSRRDWIIGIGEAVFARPELGFKEKHTAGMVRDTFDSLGLAYEEGLGVTGIKASLKGRSHGLKAAVLGEMDAVVCPGHRNADPMTGASHSCGHHAQIASMLAVAAGLVESGVYRELDGDVAFLAVPAEEYVELEYREKLYRQGTIGFFGGKQELIRLGAFDDIDMAMMVHASANTPEPKVFVGGGSTGFIGKSIRFTGKEAHAGGEPFEGINALNAAMIGMMAIHTQRETFRDEDSIRVHPIITKGGDLVNIVPADVRMETYVRGRSMEAVLSASRKVNRALEAGAYAVGAEVEIQEFPGYLPLNQDPVLTELFQKNGEAMVGKEHVVKDVHMGGSTDMGDLSAIMPIIHPAVGGFAGAGHSKEFQVVDPEAAYILPAKLMAMTVVDLLSDGAGAGKKVKENHKLRYTKASYLSMWEELLRIQL